MTQAEYDAANEAFKIAFDAFQPILAGFKVGSVGYAEFGAAQAEYKKAHDAFDVAFFAMQNAA
jgi:hypothetical protein